MTKRGTHLNSLYFIRTQFAVLILNLAFFKHSSPVKILSALAHENSFQDGDLIFMLIFKNVCKPTALISKFSCLSALRRETASGCDEALLPMGSQPGLEIQHVSQDGGVWGHDTTYIMWGCRTGRGVYTNHRLLGPIRTPRISLQG